MCVRSRDAETTGAAGAGGAWGAGGAGGAGGASAPIAICTRKFLGAVRVQVMGATGARPV